MQGEKHGQGYRRGSGYHQLLDDERQSIETTINELEQALKKDDKSAIQTKLDALTEASGRIAERVYRQQSSQSSGEKAKENVVDAQVDDFQPH